MGVIEDELAQVRKLAEHVVTGCKLVSCVQTMVRAEIKRTNFKLLVVCMQFPDNYPHVPLLIELKSKTLSERLLQGLNNVSESHARKYLGQPQILQVLQFLRNFLDENPLAACYNEINNLRKLCDGTDELKLKQKSSSIHIKITNNKYFVSARIIVPDHYPNVAIEFNNIDSNFSPAFMRHMIGQVNELTRRCVEPPLKKLKPNEPPFRPAPSLEKAVKFLVDCVKRLPTEHCQYCKQVCFLPDPALIEVDENSPRHVERVYCGHLFHQECLFSYMKTPPFDNKKCMVCGHKIFHPKWSLSDKLAENRWAHEQARERELSEVEDFFK